MGTGGEMGFEDGVAREVVDAGFRVHTALGPGLLESVYVRVLAYELEKRGLRVARQVPIPIRYEELAFEEGYRADLLVEDCVLVEVKSTEANHPVHRKQVLTYLRLADLRLGLLLNFGLVTFKAGAARIVNGLPDEAP